MGVQVHHRYATVDGHRLFYREAGRKDAPALVLLHGFPTSSFMFRDLIPRLADRYRVIAPDHLGFGLSDAPSAEEFDYTFDALADLTEGLLDQLGLTRYAIYVQDYGAPIGWRLALRHPQAITAIVTQNGNGYDEGFVESFWTTVWDYQREQTPDTEAAIRTALDVEGIKWQYLTGVDDETLVSPDTWIHDAAMVGRPGNDEIQLTLFRDYATNAPMYPALHDYLRTSRVPVLAVWGQGDPIFGPDGARAFGKDASDAEIHLLDGGHFLLETAGRRGRRPDPRLPATSHGGLSIGCPNIERRYITMGLAWQQGPLAAGSIGHFLTAQPLPEHLLFAEPLRRRMRVRLGDDWIADSENVLLLHEPGRYPVAYFPLDDIREGVLVAEDRITPHGDLGDMQWYTVVVGERRRPPRRVAAHGAARVRHCADPTGCVRVAGNGRVLRRGRTHRRTRRRPVPPHRYPGHLSPPRRSRRRPRDRRYAPAGGALRIGLRPALVRSP